MAHSSWGSGWPNCQTGRIITLNVNGLRLPVRREVAPVVAKLVDELQRARGKAFRADWSWGFACRAISGTNTPSNHSWGLAVDLDAPENPYASAAVHASPHPLRKTYTLATGRKVQLRSTMPANADAIARKWGFRWGGDYVNKPDPMHFEFMGSVADAERLGGSVEKQIGDILRRGDRGPGVTEAQRLLKAGGYDPGPIDGIFGAGTEKAVNAFKANNGLNPNGVVGAGMWKLLVPPTWVTRWRIRRPDGTLGPAVGKKKALKWFNTWTTRLKRGQEVAVRKVRRKKQS